MVKSGDILKRNGRLFEVICVDENTFVIGERKGTITDYEKLEAYSNNENIVSLAELNFEKVKV